MYCVDYIQLYFWIQFKYVLFYLLKSLQSLFIVCSEIRELRWKKTCNRWEREKKKRTNTDRLEEKKHSEKPRLMWKIGGCGLLYLVNLWMLFFSVWTHLRQSVFFSLILMVTADESNHRHNRLYQIAPASVWRQVNSDKHTITHHFKWFSYFRWKCEISFVWQLEACIATQTHCPQQG